MALPAYLHGVLSHQAETEMEGSDQEDEEVSVLGDRWKPRPSVRLRRSKFKVLNDPRSTGSLVPEKEFKRARSYPLQSLPEVQNLQSWQTRSEERAAALAKIPASLTDVWKDLDIESEGTWLPTVSRMISDVIRNQLYKEGFTDEDWELDRARSRRARKGYTFYLRNRNRPGASTDRAEAEAMPDSAIAQEQPEGEMQSVKSREERPAEEVQPAKPRRPFWLWPKTQARLWPKRKAARRKRRSRKAKNRDPSRRFTVRGEDAGCVEMRSTLGLPSYADVVLARWGKCKAETADILVDPAPTKAWRLSSTHACRVHPNGVHGSPHKRILHRLLKTATGSEELIGKEVEHECEPPPDIPDYMDCLGSEVILTVSVHGKDGNKEQEYDILSTQTLEELRDAFYFAEDWKYDGPTRLDSACFFIDGIFYSDRRWASSLDYSKELIPHVQQTGCQNLRETSSRSMTTRLSDLERIPFGERCAYIHQGNEEHAIYFTGARLPVLSSDCPLKEAYPLLTFMRDFPRKLCQACIQTLAFWAVHNAVRCPRNPTYVCQLCFRHYFQDEDGKLLRPLDYQVFPYLHSS
ncbi:Snapc3 [Symbiodinium necroappetens]|uniref:Snapc3 protein n=1 Tax=Symbiodinium necroappetens TaxID=1628268 RepID=A0A812SL27_9DINO|nr:Snapc3 [Symbiodinium necroappetens]